MTLLPLRNPLTAERADVVRPILISGMRSTGASAFSADPSGRTGPAALIMRPGVVAWEVFFQFTSETGDM
jgi:hypothetical protein